MRAYWTTGVLAIILVILAFWGVARYGLLHVKLPSLPASAALPDNSGVSELPAPPAPQIPPPDVASTSSQ